jgi:hypothetical protein
MLLSVSKPYRLTSDVDRLANRAGGRRGLWITARRPLSRARG